MRTIVAALALVSSQAFACPDLTGTYTCTYSDGSTEIVSMAQENKDGVTVYTYNGSSVPADNKAYPVPDDETLKEGTFRAWCDDTQVLKAELLGKYYNNGAYFGDLTLNMDFSIENNNLKQTTTGMLKSSSGDYPLNNEVLCTRN